jgi:hypothetical protein
VFAAIALAVPICAVLMAPSPGERDATAGTPAERGLARQS